MTDAARSLRQRNQPGLASADKPEEPSAFDSQQRPAMRFFEPLPLGGNAFMAPLAPPPEQREINWRRIAFYAGLVVGACLLLGGVVYALLSSTNAKPQPDAVAVAPQVEPAKKPPVSPEPPVQPAAAVEQKPEAAAPVAEAPVAPAVAAAEPPKPAEAEARPARESGSTASESKSSARKSARRVEKIEKPSRADVIAAMARVQPAVKACFAGTHGVVTVDMTVKGSGRVSQANVTGQTGAIGSCIARAVRKAKFPEFTADSISIRYPMQF